MNRNYYVSLFQTIICMKSKIRFILLSFLLAGFFTITAKSQPVTKTELKKLAGLTPDSLADRQGCSIYLHKRGKKMFSGATTGKECQSSLRGAAYATSEVTVYPDKLVSWDRGWDKDDKQVWGAEKGGYVFVKERTLQ